MEQKINLSSLLPLPETTLCTLLSLLHSKQGEHALKYIAEKTHKHVKLTFEQYYQILEKLREKHLVVKITSDSTKQQSHQLYTITPLGYEVVQLELKRLKQLTSELETTLQFNVTKSTKTSH